MLPNIAVSTGSACTSSSPKPSHVLLSLGINKQLINSSLRIGIGRFNTKEDMNIVAESIIKAVNKKN
jgi:cysteine desulfurase